MHNDIDALLQTFFEDHPHVLEGPHLKYVRVDGSDEPDLRLDTPAMMLFVRWTLDNGLVQDTEFARQCLARLEREWYGR